MDELARRRAEGPPTLQTELDSPSPSEALSALGVLTAGAFLALTPRGMAAFVGRQVADTVRSRLREGSGESPPEQHGLAPITHLSNYKETGE